MKNSDRISELNKQISTLETERREIWNQEKIEKNKKLVGKYFREYKGNDSNETLFMDVERSDEWGNLFGKIVVLSDPWAGGGIFSGPNASLSVPDWYSEKK
jgi:hypothetical protein